MILELPVLRVQVQRSPLKPGRAPLRRYRPEALLEVAELRVSPDGAVGIDADGAEHLDVHHARHPQTRDPHGRAGLSLMTTGDYVALRERFGPHLVDGIAGESMLLDYPAGLAHRAMPSELTVVATGRAAEPLVAVDNAAGAAVGAVAGPDAPGARLVAADLRVAKPCVEFTRFCLGLGPEALVDPAIRDGMATLDDGARGYKMAATGSGVIRAGDLVVLDLPVGGAA